MRRREFLHAASRLTCGSLLVGGCGFLMPRTASEQTWILPAQSIIPVVGDGKWIWTEPPEDATGYLEPRSYQLEVGIELEGQGNATQIAATTPVPVVCPEQKIEDSRLQTQGCQAQLRSVADFANQLILAAPTIQKRQVIRAVASFQLTLMKDYRGFDRDQFEATQTVDRGLRFPYLTDSPGIQVRHSATQSLLRKLVSPNDHPWDQAQTFYHWVWENIQARIGAYTSVVKAIESREGDCEERAAVFVALCRAAGIPARLVWVPNHNWAEFYLVDQQQQGHWIPVHTAAYSWFGWTGAHELVIQKGDHVRVPEKKQPQRLLPDWLQWKGSRPQVRFTARLEPLAATEAEDPGPGAREKTPQGQWQPLKTHPQDKYTRDA